MAWTSPKPDCFSADVLLGLAATLVSPARARLRGLDLAGGGLGEVMDRSDREIFEFGPFRLDVRERLLLQEGEPIALAPKVFDLLLILVRNAGCLVRKQELREVLWPDSIVTEASLTQTVSLLRKALGEGSAGTFIENVPRIGYRFVVAVTAPSLAAVEPARRRRALAMSPLLLAAMTLVASVAAVTAVLHGTQRAGASVRSRRSVAVLGFKNLSSRPAAAWLSTALSEMLNAEISAGGRLRAIPGEAVTQARRGLSLSDEAPFTSDEVARLQRVVAADVVVLGSYMTLQQGDNATLRIDMRLQDGRTGDTLDSVTETGSEARLFDLVARAGQRVRHRLGAPSNEAAAAQQARASFPSHRDAVRLYTEGLARLRLFDAAGARLALERAVAAESDHPMAHAALAAAWAELGHDARARAEAGRALERSQGLPRQERLLIDARYHETHHRWTKAAEIYRSLFTFFPDDLEYGLRLASAQTAGGRAEDALATIEELKRLPSIDPRIDVTEAAARSALSDFEGHRRAASRAVATAREQGARHVLAEALLWEGHALRALGQLEPAAAALDESRETFRVLGNRQGEARTMISLASVLFTRGQFPEARRLDDQALARFREAGNLKWTAIATNNLAGVLYHDGDLPGARSAFEEALALAEEIGDAYGAAAVLGNLAGIRRDEGDYQGALAVYDQALALHRRNGNGGGAAAVLTYQAGILEQRGELASACEKAREALALHRQTGRPRGIADALDVLGSVAHARGNLNEARGLHEEALGLATNAGSRILEAQVLCSLSRVEASLGHLQPARERAEKALGLARGMGKKAAMADALSALAEVLALGGDHGRARRQHEEALALRKQLGDRGGAAHSRLQLAEIDAEQGRLAAAAVLIRASKADLAGVGDRDGAAWADILLARALVGGGRPLEARDALGSVEAVVASTPTPRLRMGARITRARLLARLGSSAEAVTLLQELVAEARSLRLAALELEARLALGEIEAQAGRPDAARLATLEADARAAGFHAIAWRAARAAEQQGHVARAASGRR